MMASMRYNGGKNGAGVFHTILRQIPPHAVFIEAFGGSAALTRRKAPVRRSVVVELDERQVAVLRARIVRADVEIRHASAFDVLATWPWAGDEFVYFDPPYLHATRRDLALYRYELDDHHHASLLTMLERLPVPFALSGYRSAMYDDASSRNGWRRIDFPAMTRRGVAVESLWMNYPAPAVIADSGYAGADFRDRQRIKRKAERWVQRFEALPSLERQAILERLGRSTIVNPGAAGLPAGPIVTRGDAAASSCPTMPAEQAGLFS